ncbi:glycoside hydrolase family 88 protein [uncultured Microbacterium sp.]|uniref:glycoside hydrolase family 88 protein n=1 Tax=uncultured Microbacterium sp. TaxID=191216 RepID=UPI0035CB9624
MTALSGVAAGDQGVAWGVEVYVASDDAADALAQTRRAGAATSHEDSPELAASVADALIHLGFKTWDFGDSVAFEALIAASDVLGDERWVRFAHGYGRAWATRSRPFVRLDCTVPGRALVGIATRFGDAQLLHTLKDLADYLMTRPTLDGVFETWERSPLLAPYGDATLDDHAQALLEHPPAGVFVDCLHFDPPFFAALGVALDDSAYLDAGIEQALGYIRQLQTPDGLFDHFTLRGEAGSFGPGWGRGQGWAILGLLEVIDSIDHFGGDDRTEVREALAASARALLQTMVGLQREDGHWFAVVTDPDSGDEFSTAGFIAFALHTALDAGIVQGHEMIASLSLARQAILASLDDRGQLREVSAAVYASTEPTHYGRVPRGYVVPWGQGPALLALVAKGNQS